MKGLASVFLVDTLTAYFGLPLPTTAVHQFNDMLSSNTSSLGTTAAWGMQAPTRALRCNLHTYRYVAGFRRNGPQNIAGRSRRLFRRPVCVVQHCAQHMSGVQKHDVEHDIYVCQTGLWCSYCCNMVIQSNMTATLGRC